MSNDDNELIEILCDKCGAKKTGTYKELFGNCPSLLLQPKLRCRCGGNICIGIADAAAIEPVQHKVYKSWINAIFDWRGPTKKCGENNGN